MLEAYLGSVCWQNLKAFDTFCPNLTLCLYRKLAALAGMTMDRVPNKNPLAALDEEKKEHQVKVVGHISLHSNNEVV